MPYSTTYDRGSNTRKTMIRHRRMTAGNRECSEKKEGSFSSLQGVSPEKESGSGSLRGVLKVWCKTIFKTYTGAKATGLEV